MKRVIDEAAVDGEITYPSSEEEAKQTYAKLGRKMLNLLEQ